MRERIAVWHMKFVNVIMWISHLRRDLTGHGIRNKPGFSGRTFWGNVPNKHFRIILNRDKFGPWGKVLNWSNADGNIIRQELGKVNWELLLLDISAFDMSETFKGQLIKVQVW